MVVISIIALLAAILVPVVQRVRESARDTQCKSNLRQIAQGLMQYSSSSPSGEYCSGAWDWKRDGDVTQYGWVADLVHQGILVNDLLCPSNRQQVSGTYYDLLTMNPTTNTCADSLGAADQTLPDGTVVPNPCRQLAGASTKGQIVNDLLLLNGYNTNYAASWFLVRTDVIIDNQGRLVNRNAGCAKSRRERSCTIGPLSTPRVGGKVPSNIVPMMGCGGQAELGRNLLPEAVGDYGTDQFLAEMYTAGPRDPTTLSDPTISGSGSGAAVWFGPWNATLQDYRAFGPVHGGRRRGTCNIVFLDGNIKTFADENGDGLLNNGFPVSSQSGYADDAIELPAVDIYSKWSLDSARIP